MPHDIPIPPNIQATIPSPNLIKYQVQTGAQDTARFYEAEMPKNQWMVSQQHLVETDLAVLSFAKEAKQATIIIHQGDGTGTRVMITVTALG
jgi:hypothetical protein